MKSFLASLRQIDRLFGTQSRSIPSSSEHQQASPKSSMLGLLSGGKVGFKTAEINLSRSLRKIGIAAAGISSTVILSTLSASAGTNVSSTPSVSVTGEAIGYTVDAVSLSSSFNNQTTCTRTTTRNFNITLPAGATVRQAILYWATDLSAGDNAVTLAGNTITASQSWNDTILTTAQTYNGYRADVTARITGTGTYAFTGLSSATTSPFQGGCLSGATLVVIYNTTRSDPNALNRIEMFDGFQGIRGAGLGSGGTNSTVTLPTSPLGVDLSFMTALSWQGNSLTEAPAAPNNYNDTLTVNGSAVFNSNNPIADNGNGSGANKLTNSTYAVDADTFDISSIVSTVGATPLTITNTSVDSDYVISQGFIVGSRGPDISDAPNSGGFSYGIARHKIVPTLASPSLYLGSSVDGEVVDNTYAGNINATFDDVNGINDDNGIIFSPLTPGATNYSIPASRITARGSGTLHAWIDFNKNGTFDSGEYTSVSVTNNTPAGALNWQGITVGSIGSTYARFRFTTDTTVTNITPSGLATDGEVEDYQVPITLLTDYSDAPSSYGSASHTIVSGTYLGTTITPDGAVYSTAQADGDAGDDGITLNGAAAGTYILNASTESATNNTISINPTTNGFASLWIDYNQDGDFADTGERVLNDQAVSSGTQNLSFNVPISAIPGYTFARVRYSTTAGRANTPAGTASNGEVEDYVFKVQKTTAPLACSAGSSTVYTSLDFRYFERVDSGTHWARRAGTVQNGKLVDVRFTRSGTSLGGSDTWDAGQTAPADAITQTSNLGGVTRNFTIDVFEAGTLIPVVGNYIFNFTDIDGHNIATVTGGTIGSRTTSMPSTTYTNNFESQHFYGVAGYTLSGDTRLYLDTASNFPADLFIQSAASNNTDTAITARQLAIRVAWENKSTMSFEYKTGGFGGIAIDGQGYSTADFLPNCSLNLSISGTVFNDTDSSKIQNGIEAGTNGGGLNAVLLNSSNAVVNTVAVAANGTYSFNNVSAAAYTVLITTGNTATVSLPTNWVSTGENLIGIPDTTVDSKLTVVVGTSNVSGANFGIKQNPTDVLLLKRITAINGLTTNPNDNKSLTDVLVDPNWKTGYVVGATDGGKVKPGDTIEYTIYYLNNGGRKAKSVRICDRLNANQSFYPDTYPDSTFIQNNTTNPNPVGSGMQVQKGTDDPLTLTNLSDNDGGQFIAATAPVTALPTNCNSITGAPNNDYGALILDLVTNPGSPNLTALPGKTSQGSPNDSFGFWRFITKVKEFRP
jgi:GEVED domain